MNSGSYLFFSLPKVPERVDGFADDVGGSDSWAYCTAPVLLPRSRERGGLGREATQ